MDQLDVAKIAELFPAHQRQGFLTAWRLVDALVQQPQLVEHLRTFAAHVEKAMGIAPLQGFNPVSHQDVDTGAKAASPQDAVGSASAPPPVTDIAPPDPVAGASATVETIDQNVGQDSPATKSPSSSRYRG